ncbi:MAG TPA: D-alanyl-D-alanine carboxypeptidase family protein [Candidatus Limnocylindrales bacterium]
MRTPSGRLLALRTVAVAALLGAGLMVVPAATPTAVRGLGPLPDCRLADILTIPRGYDDWRSTLVDWILSVGKSYVPPDLVNVRTSGISGGGLIRKVAIADLKAMVAAAKANGTPLVSWSAYRSYAQQAALFKGYGGLSAIRFSARPGHSEHQLGVVIDFVGVGDSGLTSNWEVTRTGAWMMKNAWKYGWLMSYPKGKQDVVCYSYEPWHYRYYGRELAAKIHDSGLTTREYLWANYTVVDPTTGLPIATPTPVPSPTASLGPSDEPPSDSPPVSQGPQPGASAGETSPPSSPAGAWFGLDPPVFVAVLLLIVASVALIASVGFLRRPPPRHLR